jgi:hypothetical protein
MLLAYRKQASPNHKSVLNSQSRKLTTQKVSNRARLPRLLLPIFAGDRQAPLTVIVDNQLGYIGFDVVPRLDETIVDEQLQVNLVVVGEGKPSAADFGGSHRRHHFVAREVARFARIQLDHLSNKCILISREARLTHAHTQQLLTAVGGNTQASRDNHSASAMQSNFAPVLSKNTNNITSVCVGWHTTRHSFLRSDRHTCFAAVASVDNTRVADRWRIATHSTTTIKLTTSYDRCCLFVCCEPRG